MAHITSVWAAPKLLGWLPLQEASETLLAISGLGHSSQEAAAAVRRRCLYRQPFLSKELFTLKIIFLVSFQEVELLSHWTVHISGS